MRSAIKNPMTSVNISLLANQRRYVERKVSRGGYSTVSEYFRELLRQDEQRPAGFDLFQVRLLMDSSFALIDASEIP
jgi:hypothetical protein